MSGDQRHLASVVKRVGIARAAHLERACAEEARAALPRPLRWTVDHPRVLRAVYALRPAWRPMIVFGHDGSTTIVSIKHPDGRLVLLDHWQEATLAAYFAAPTRPQDAPSRRNR